MARDTRRYLAGQAGAAAYAEAGRRSRRRKPADPQRAPVAWRDPRLAVAEMMAPCATVTAVDGDGEPAAWCGDPMAEHHLTDPSAEWPAGHRTRCTRGTAAGWCPCRAYTSPQTEGDPREPT